MFFSEAPNGAKKDQNTDLKTTSGKKHYVFSKFDFSKGQTTSHVLKISRKNINNEAKCPMRVDLINRDLSDTVDWES